MSLLSIGKAFDAFRAHMPRMAQLYVGGGTGEPLDLAEHFKADLERAANLMFRGVWVPGINTTDWAGFHDTARAETSFVCPAWRRSFEQGRTDFVPMHYSESTAWLESAPFDGAVVMVTPPDAQGEVSLGISPDFAGAILARTDIPALGLVHPDMPAPIQAPRFPAGRFSLLAEASQPLLTVEESPLNPAFEIIARHILTLLTPGDTLQFGLGNLQQAMLQALGGMRGFSIHSGMISTPVMRALAHDPAMRIDTGIAVGTPDFYAALRHFPQITYNPARFTHSARVLAAIPRFKAINSVVEVDLFGQANAEFIRGQQVSGTGGLADFLRGARLSDGGCGITALVSTAAGGTISRIVPRLSPDATTIVRADMDAVVTEFGVAHLRGRSLDARAEALIAIADPRHQSALTEAWRKMRHKM